MHVVVLLQQTDGQVGYILIISKKKKKKSNKLECKACYINVFKKLLPYRVRGYGV
jgi:hypothetical protein